MTDTAHGEGRLEGKLEGVYISKFAFATAMLEEDEPIERIMILRGYHEKKLKL